MPRLRVDEVSFTVSFCMTFQTRNYFYIFKGLLKCKGVVKNTEEEYVTERVRGSQSLKFLLPGPL